MGIKVYENTISLNKKLDGDDISNKLDRELYKFTKQVERELKSTDKYVPVASGDLKRSIHVEKKAANKYELSSINYPSRKYKGGDGGRYNDMTSNREYKIKGGSRIIPAGKNAGKGHWFERVLRKNKKSLKASINKIIEGK